jgi:hypothetical protein
MIRAMKLLMAAAIAVTGFWAGSVVLPVQKAEAASCIWRYGHQYCRSDYWRGDCFYYYDELYCRVYKKKKTYGGDGYGGSSGY